MVHEKVTPEILATDRYCKGAPMMHQLCQATGVSGVADSEGCWHKWLVRTAARPLTCSAFSLKIAVIPIPSIIFSVVSTIPFGMYLGWQGRRRPRTEHSDWLG